MSLSLSAFKYLSAAVVLAATVFGTIGAVFLSRVKWRTKLEAFAGGAFIGAGMLHLLPEALHDLEILKFSTYPIAPTVAVLVFVIFTLIDMLSMSDLDTVVLCERHSISGHEHRSGTYDALLEPREVREEVPSNFGPTMSQLDAASLSFYSIVSVDSAIEGLTLGVLQKCPKVFAILCAVVAHKPVEACAVSLVMLKRKPTKCGFCLLIGFYSIMSTFGVALGIRLQTAASPTVIGFIESMAAGAFLFMGCHEWMELFAHKEVWRTRQKLWHYAAFLAGVIWLCIVALIKALSGN
jgi:zinc transporter 1/2/3